MTASSMSGHTVIITGAGSGIGRATAELLAERGAQIVVADIAETANETVEAITAAGGRAVAVIGDITDEAVVEDIVAKAAETGGTLGLVNNAGIMDTFAGVADVDTALWDRIIRVNLTAPMLLSRAAVRVMRERGAGSIVNVGSSASLRGAAAGAAYTASKHGIVGLTVNTAFMYAKEGLRCNAICPGGVETHIMETSAAAGASNMDPKQGLEMISPVHQSSIRMAKAIEQAQVIAFLLSDAASDVNGAVFPVDAGWAAG